MMRLLNRFVGWLFLPPIILLDWFVECIVESDRRRQKRIELKKQKKEPRS